MDRSSNALLFEGNRTFMPQKKQYNNRRTAERSQCESLWWGARVSSKPQLFICKCPSFILILSRRFQLRPLSFHIRLICVHVIQ